MVESLHTRTSSADGLQRLSAWIVFLSVGLAIAGFFSANWYSLPFAKIYVSAYVASGAGMMLIVWYRQGRFLLGCASAVGAVAILFPVVMGGYGTAILYFIWLMVLAAGLGGLIIRQFTADEDFTPLERTLFAIISGLAVLALLVLCLGLAGQLTLTPVLVLLGILNLAAIPELRRMYREVTIAAAELLTRVRPGEDLRLPAFCVAASVNALLGGFWWSLAPAVQCDSMHYQLGIPAWYVHSGVIIDMPETLHSYFCQLSGMHYSLGLLLEGQALAKLFHFGSGLLTAGLCLCIGIRYFNMAVGLVAGTLMLCMPHVTYLLGTAYVDLTVTLYILAALFALCRWLDARQTRWLFLFSLMGGFAVAVKLSALLYGVPLGAILLFYLIVSGNGRLTAARTLAVLTMGFALGAGPWLLKTWWWTGNPVYPMLNDVFQSRPFPIGNPHGSWSIHGVSHNWAWFFRLPWDLNFSSEAFGSWPSACGFAGLSLVGLPWMIRACNQSQRRVVLIMLLTGFGGLALAFKSVQAMRYMVPAGVILAVIAAVNLNLCWQSLSSATGKRTLVVAMSTASLWFMGTRLAHICTNPGYPWNAIQDCYPMRLLSGGETESQFLSRTIRQYDTYQHLSGIVSNDEMTVTLCQGAPRLNCVPARILAAPLHGHLEALTGLLDVSEDELFAFFDTRQIRYLVVDATCPHFISGLTDQFLESHCEFLFARNSVYLYRVCDRINRRFTDDSQLLTSNGQLQIEEGSTEPGGWEVFGEVSYLPDAGNSDSVHVAVKAGVDIRQVIALSGGGIGRLCADVRSDHEDQYAWLRIDWLDEKRQLIKAENLVRPAKREWTTYRSWSSVPKDARFARVLASTHSRHPVWFDNLELHLRSPAVVANLIHSTDSAKP